MKLLADFFPILLFFAAYKLYGIYIATAVAIAASFVQVGLHWLRHRRFETMHLVTLGLLVVFGGLTIVLQDRTFIMWKPSIVNWLFGAVFIGSQFFGKRPLVERIMGHAIEIPAPLWRRLNLAWGLFFLFLGAVNLYVANDFFVADRALHGAVEMAGDIDLDRCAGQFQGQALALCQRAHDLEARWVNFKLFGLLGLTVVFVIGQAFFLARHAQRPEDED